MERTDRRLAEFLEGFGRDVLRFLSPEDLKELQFECFRGHLIRTDRVLTEIIRSDEDTSLKMQDSIKAIFDVNESFSYLSTRSELPANDSTFSLTWEQFMSVPPSLELQEPAKIAPKVPQTGSKITLKLKKDPKQPSLNPGTHRTAEELVEGFTSQLFHLQLSACKTQIPFLDFLGKASQIVAQFLQKCASMGSTSSGHSILGRAILKAERTSITLQKMGALHEKPNIFFARFVIGTSSHPDPVSNWTSFSKQAISLVFPNTILWLALESLVKIHDGLHISLSAITKNPNNFGNKLTRLAEFAVRLKELTGDTDGMVTGVSCAQVIQAAQFYADFANKIIVDTTLRRAYEDFPLKRNLFLRQNEALLVKIEAECRPRV